jgi:hypothetical protein
MSSHCANDWPLYKSLVTLLVWSQCKYLLTVRISGQVLMSSLRTNVWSLRKFLATVRKSGHCTNECPLHKYLVTIQCTNVWPLYKFSPLYKSLAIVQISSHPTNLWLLHKWLATVQTSGDRRNVWPLERCVWQVNCVVSWSPLSSCEGEGGGGGGGHWNREIQWSKR